MDDFRYAKISLMRGDGAGLIVGSVDKLADGPTEGDGSHLLHVGDVVDLSDDVPS